MRKDSDLNPPSILDNNRRVRNYPLRLVIPNSPPTNFITSFTRFASTICRKNNQSLYTLRAYEPSNNLACKLSLEIENDSGYISVICKFPSAFYESLNRENENLVHIILTKFQMNIMRRLLLFAISHKARDLLIQINEEYKYAFAAYQEIATYEDKVPTTDGKLAQMTILPNAQTWSQWIAIMDKIARKSRQTLWTHYHTDLSIREYLKTHHLD